MAILNEQITLCPPHALPYFKGVPRRLRLEPGTKLCKYTEFTLFGVTPGRTRPNGTRGSDSTQTSEWWIFLDSSPANADPGFDHFTHEARRRAARGSFIDGVRDVYAVKRCWNALDLPQLGTLRVQRVRLLQPVFGFHGVAAEVNDEGNLISGADARRLRGGGMQILIPNLTTQLTGDGFFLLS